MSVRDLQRQAITDATRQDAAVVRFNAELRRVFRRLSALLAAHVEDFDVEDGRLRTTLHNIARVMAMKRQARVLLKRAGYDAMAADVLGSAVDALAASAIANQRVTVSIGPRLEKVLAAWRGLRLADLLDVGDAIARTLQRTALDATLGLRPVDRLVRDLATALDKSERQARTTFDTAVSTFSRQMEVLGSDGDPDELFVYVGPVDSRMREFCGEWVGKVRTRKAIDRLDNGQLPNVMLTGGGYNCRHLFKRVSQLDEELIAIAGTDQRAPGIDTQLERVAA